VAEGGEPAGGLACAVYDAAALPVPAGEEGGERWWTGAAARGEGGGDDP